MTPQLPELLFDQEASLIYKSQKEYLGNFIFSSLFYYVNGLFAPFYIKNVCIAGGGPNGRACPYSNFLKGKPCLPLVFYSVSVAYCTPLMVYYLVTMTGLWRAIFVKLRVMACVCRSQVVSRRGLSPDCHR